MSEEATVYRVSEFCKRYVLSKATFYREVSAERLFTIKRGRTTLIVRAEAERWFQSLDQSKPQETA
jgi:hypothetical protein